ncbi:hypothetical protein D3C83_150540 [compost metagenome]
MDTLSLTRVASVVVSSTSKSEARSHTGCQAEACVIFAASPMRRSASTRTFQRASCRVGAGGAVAVGVKFS